MNCSYIYVQNISRGYLQLLLKHKIYSLWKIETCVLLLLKLLFPALTTEESSEQTVFAGSYVNVALSNIDLENISIGYVLCDIEKPIPVTTKFEARIVIFNIVLPITKGYTVRIFLYLGSTLSTVSQILKTYNSNFSSYYIYSVSWTVL